MNPRWVEESRTRLQVLGDADDPKAVETWPAPCAICGAQYVLTPEKRWRITHWSDLHQGPNVERTTVTVPNRVRGPELVRDIVDRMAP